MGLVLRSPSEPTTLSRRLQDIGWSRKQSVVLQGCFQFLAIVLAVAALAGIVDAAWHLPAFVRGCARGHTMELRKLLPSAHLEAHSSTGLGIACRTNSGNAFPQVER